ncbi:MAG: acyl-CoA synthetase [Candidatus Dojkabacteria bacterium]
MNYSNITQYCLDAHLHGSIARSPAFVSFDETLQKRTETSYLELAETVNSYAAVLKQAGAKKGDRVVLYMAHSVELVAAMLACARIGAIHSVIFAGFSDLAIRSRLEDLRPKIIISHDYLLRREKIVPLIENVREASEGLDFIEHVFVKNSSETIRLELDPKEQSLDDLAKKYLDTEIEPEQMTELDPLFVLYTSGSTGKPKGIVHGSVGYREHIVKTARKNLGLAEGVRYWCSADPGWITGHSYIAYAPLILGVTQYIVQGPLDFPDPSKWLKVLAQEQIESFYTAPTALRKIKSNFPQPSIDFDLSALSFIGSVGEPINTDVRKWFTGNFGKEGETHFVDTWWQTETGGHIIVNGQLEDGLRAEILEGELILLGDWPSKMIDCWGDRERYLKYFGTKKDTGESYFRTGDMAEISKDGKISILGRIDDVLNISGHRLGTVEFENIAVACDLISEAAAIAVDDPVTGQAVVLFVTAKEDLESELKVNQQLTYEISREIGKFALPKEIIVRESLPKTRSGKIMRRVLKAEYLGQNTGDTSTLAD